jgi:sulfite reductase alpha subunit
VCEKTVSNKKPTPLVDELEAGPWPSFVKEIKKSAEDSPMASDLLGVLERSYAEKIGHWKHGGLVGVKGYGGGVIGRYNDLAAGVSRRRRVPHGPHQSPCGLVLHLGRVAPAMRHLGSPRLGPDQFPRGDRRCRVSGGEDRPSWNRSSTSFSKLASTSAGRVGAAHAQLLLWPARCEWACFDTLDVTQS